MDIIKVPYGNLLKLELPAFARKVIAIVEKYDPEELKIKEGYELLLAQQPNIELLKRPFRAHPITKQLSPLRSDCLSFAQRIVYNVGKLVRDCASNPDNTVLSVNAVVIQHLHRLDLCKNEEIFVERITNFFNDLDRDEALETALSEFNLTKDINNLRNSTSSLIELLTKRTKSLSERHKIKTREVAAQVIKALDNVVKEIEVGFFKNPDINYEPMVNELNQTIVQVKYKVNMRLLFNKRKAEELKQNESNNESTNPEVVPTSIMRNMEVETTMDNGFENRFTEKLDQKKTVASSSKHLQPPIDNKEA